MELSPGLTTLIAAAVFVAALLFAIAGHTGATAYLALFALIGMAPDQIKPSVAGLLGYWSASPAWPQALPVWAVVALAGGWIGAEIGSRRLSGTTIRRMLGLILLLASVRMFF